MTKNSQQQQLDELNERLDKLEQTVFRLDADISDLTLMMTELATKMRQIQELTAKIGHAQNRIHEYISHWPFVRVVKNGKDIS